MRSISGTEARTNAVVIVEVEDTTLMVVTTALMDIPDTVDTKDAVVIKIQGYFEFLL